MDALYVQQVHPEHLHAISTSHKWALGAIAELIDNAQDPGVDASEMWIDKEDISRKTCLTFVDNGQGMDLDNLIKMLSFGYCDKKKTEDKFSPTDKPIGQYGNGFKSGSMRLAKDAVVLTVCQERQAACVGLLSQTMCSERDLDKVVIPIIKYTLPDLQPCTEQEQSSNQFSQSLNVILEFSPYHKEEELKEELRKLLQQKPPRNIKRQRGQKGSGTKIVLYNLKMRKGLLELDFQSDDKDVRNPQTQDESDVQQQTKVFEYKQSLRRYCSILYQKPKMAIYIRKKKVNTCFLKSTLTRSRTFTYRPKEKGQCKITFGIPKNRSTVEDHGVMIYHRNRLITPYKKLGCQLKPDGPGVKVLGVVDVSDVLTPTHNKQDFNEDSSAKRSALQVFSSKLDVYCGIGEKIDPSKGQRNNPWDWVQCNKCTRWRRLPEFAGKKIPNKWYCKNNPDQARNRCEIPEEEYNDNEYDLPCSTAAAQQGDGAVATGSKKGVSQSSVKAASRGKLTKETPATVSHSTGDNPTTVSHSTGDSNTGSSAKKQEKKKMAFSAAMNIIILKQVIKENPYRDNSAWDTVTANLAKVDGRFENIVPKTVIDKINNLRQAFKKGEIQKRKGTPEELSETVTLLQKLEELVAGAKSTAGRKRKKSVKASGGESCADVSSSSHEVVVGASTSNRAEEEEESSVTPTISKKTQINLIQAAVEQVSPFLPWGQTLAGSSATSVDTTLPSVKRPRLSETTTPAETSTQIVNPIISANWQIQKEVTSEGEFLRGTDSDVILTVPENAIIGTAVKIFWAVSTDLEKAYRKFIMTEMWKDKKEMVVCPVAEFSVQGQQNLGFQKPLVISLPHFLPPFFDEEKVKVYYFYRDDLSRILCKSLPKTDIMKRTAGFYFDDVMKHKKVEIMTYGPSGYFMTYKDMEAEPSHIALRLYARHVQRDTPCVDIMVLVWDLRLNIKDFREVTTVMDGMVEQSTGILEPFNLEGRDHSQVEVELFFHNTSSSWSPTTGENGRQLYPDQQRFPLRRFCRCVCGTEPVRVYWSLKNSASVTTTFESHLSAGYVTMNHGGSRSPKHLSLPIWLDSFGVPAIDGASAPGIPGPSAYQPSPACGFHPVRG